MKTVLVAGATGGVGEGVLRALLANDAVRVIATSRTTERLDELVQQLDPQLRTNLTRLAGDAGSFAGALELAARAEALGGIDAAVAILGRGWWTSGKLLDLAPEEWAAVLDEMLTSHFAFARAMIPLLATRPGSLYLSIGGGAAFAPMRDAGLMSIAAAAQLMLVRVLARELGAGPPRVCELVIDGAVNTRASEAFAQPGWIRAGDVGGVVADLVLAGVTSWKPLRSEGPVVIMGERRLRPD